MQFQAGFNATGGLGKKQLKELILDSLKLTAIIQFIIGLIPFSFVYEIIQIPVISFIAAMYAISEKKEEYKQVEKLLFWLISCYSLFLIIHTTKAIIQDINRYADYENLWNFLFPIGYSILIIPFLFLFSIIVQYETLFVRLRIGSRVPKLNRKIKRNLIWFCGLSDKRLKIALNMNNYNIMAIKTEDDIREMRAAYKAILSDKN